MRWASVWASFAVALAVLLMPVADAAARGKRRAIPDLRESAGRTVRPQAKRLIRLPLTVHIATDEGDPVASRTRIARWVRRANRALRPAGLEVDVRSVRHLPAGWTSVTRWRQRRKLANYAPHDGTIHVFVIEELDTKRRRMFRRRIRGLHWRYRGLNRDLRSREYVVVTEGAPTTTFVHELGHLFGLRHSTAINNIMCSCRRGMKVQFTDTQMRSIQTGVERYAARQRRGGARSGIADRPVFRRSSFSSRDRR
jgi:hypothetical protein